MASANSYFIRESRDNTFQSVISSEQWIEAILIAKGVEDAARLLVKKRLIAGVEGKRGIEVGAVTIPEVMSILLVEL
jgi:hypothetical protein